MRVYPSLVGQRFGMLVVEQQVESSEAGQRRWLCRCDCGNVHRTTTDNLKRGRTTNCGCKKSPDLTGQFFGRLTVLGRSEKRGSRGKRRTPLWEYRCECGAITYKATDALNSPKESMCTSCAGKNSARIARQSAGFVGGTQLAKICIRNQSSANTSGCHGVYYDAKTDKYRARLKFKGKVMNFGTFDNLDDAVKARKRAEEEYFEPLVSAMGGKETC